MIQLRITKKYGGRWQDTINLGGGGKINSGKDTAQYLTSDKKLRNAPTFLVAHATISFLYTLKCSKSTTQEM